MAASNIETIGDLTASRAEALGRELVTSACLNDMKKVKVLLAEGANPNEIKEGYTALFWAVYNTNEKMVRTLIGFGADVQEKTHDITPLVAAERAGKKEIAQMLRDPKKTRLQFEAARKAGQGLLHCSDAGIAKKLLAQGADLDETDTEGNSALHLAAKNGFPEVIPVLIEAGADIDKRNHAGAQPQDVAGWKNIVRIFEEEQKRRSDEAVRAAAGEELVTAACLNNMERAKQCLAQGALVSSRETGYTALHWAAYNNNSELIRLLLDAGAAPEALNASGSTPRDMAEYRAGTDAIAMLDAEKDNRRAKAKARETELEFCAAAFKGDAKKVKNFLKQGVNINAKDELGYTALYSAALTYKEEIVSLLIKAGAAVDGKNNQGYTPLMIMAALPDTAHPRIARLLLDAGADLSEKNLAGETALDVARSSNNARVVLMIQEEPLRRERVADEMALVSAAEQQNLEEVRRLLERGASTGERLYGNTALHWAVISRQPEMVRLLLDAGADLGAKASSVASYVYGDNSDLTPLETARLTVSGEIAQMLEDEPRRREWLAGEEAGKKQAALVEKREVDALSRIIASGDCDQLRAAFDNAFWRKEEAPLYWEHLKMALLQEDKPMMRLLVTWGAPVDAEAWPLLTPRQTDLLRQCGLRQAAGMPAPDIQSADPFANHSVEMVPDEWLRVLHALQSLGAAEAVIAGGALRDTFNGAPVRDVDIFLQSRGSAKENKKLLEKVFKETRLPLAKQMTEAAGYGHAPVYEELPEPRPGASRKLYTWDHDSIYGAFAAGEYVQSCTVVAGPNKTEYNIVFMDGPVKWKSTIVGPIYPLKGGKNVPDPPADFAERLIKRFDIGLCQIACDGEKIITTPFYDADVKQKSLTPVQPNPGTPEHQERLMQKYNGWAVRAQDAASNPAPKPRLKPKKISTGVVRR